MKRTIINGLIAGLSVGMLAACGGSSQDSSSSSKLLADGEACAAAWNATTVYATAGTKVSRNGRNYSNAFWTQGNDPATSSGPAGSGQPWITGFLCGSTPTPTPTPAPTPTPTPAPTPTPTPAPTPAPTPTPTPAPTPTPTPTGSCPQWVLGKAYAVNDKVSNKGGYYQCKVAGWCSSTATAYEPGAGWAWTDAWTAIAASQCGATPTPTPTPTPAPTPTPTPAPTPTPTPAPTPTPTPTPTPAGSFRFAPYVDTSFGMSISSWAAATNQKAVSLAFFNSAGGCAGGWPTSESSLITEAQNLRSRGGNVIVSSGGWNANDIVRNCTDAAAIATTYEGVLNRLGTNYLDLDPEHGDSANNLEAAIVDRRSAALKILQDRFAAAGKTLHISFTLGVYPDSGFNAENLYVLQSAKNAGVNFDIVNPMIMDYYDGVSGTQMGARSILALQKVVAQLKTLLPGKTDAQYWAMMSATAMIGQNDNPAEVFTLADAQQVLNFARQQGMARLSFWSLGRDNGNCPGNKTASASCSGITQSQWAFSNIFGAY